MENDQVIAAVQEAQQGSKQAFGVLYEAYYQQLYYYACKRLGSEEAARDVVQETFLRVLLKIGELRNPASFSSWVYRITNNNILTALRSRTREMQTSIEWQELEQGDYRSIDTINAAQGRIAQITTVEFLPQDALEIKEDRALILRLIDTLTDVQKEAIVLCYYAGFTSPEIARILEISTSAVDKRLHDARHALQTAYKAESGRKDLTVSGAAGQTPVLTRLLREESTEVAQPQAETSITAGLMAAIPGLLATGMADPQAAARAGYFLDLAKTGALGHVAAGGHLGQALPEVVTAKASPKVPTVAKAIGVAAVLALLVGGGFALAHYGLGASRSARRLNVPPVNTAVQPEASIVSTPTAITSVVATDSVSAGATSAPTPAPQPAPTPTPAHVPAPVPTPAPVRPVITVAHAALTYPVGTTLTIARILRDAGVTAWDAQGNALAVTLERTEAIDINTLGTTTIFACARDSEGTEAITQLIRITMK